MLYAQIHSLQHIFKKIYLFAREWDHACVREWREGAGEENLEADSLLSTETDAGLDLRSHEIMIEAKTKSQMLN